MSTSGPSTRPPNASAREEAVKRMREALPYDVRYIGSLMDGRVRLVVLFGGRSAEHEISCISAFNLLRAVDTGATTLSPSASPATGQWVDAGDISIETAAAAGALPSPDLAPGSGAPPWPSSPLTTPGREPTVVFPLLHGPMGEDGTMQGLLELAGAPYIGTGCARFIDLHGQGDGQRACSRLHGIPQARWMAARTSELSDDFLTGSARGSDIPMFVKPANLGSSIGISRGDRRGELARAIELAASYR